MTEDLEKWRARMEAALTPEQREKFEERTAHYAKTLDQLRDDLLTGRLRRQRFPFASRCQYRTARSISLAGCAMSARVINLASANAGSLSSLSPAFIL
jgi:hypothetical protein